MRHDWEDVPPRTVIEPPCRRCKNCGVVQHRYKRRYTRDDRATSGYQWLPLVGRCKGKPPETPVPQ